MEEINYAELLPSKPPEGIVDWLREQNALGGEYLIYKVGTVYDPLEDRNTRAIECHCTACGEVFYQLYIKPQCDCGHRYMSIGFIHPDTGEAITSGTDTICPQCGAEVHAMHVSGIGSHNGGTHIKSAHPMTVHNINGSLALLCWRIERRITREGKELIWTHQYDGCIFTPRKKIRVTGRQSGFYSQHYTGGWRQLKRFGDEIGSHSPDMIYPWDADILIGTPAENSKLDIYLNCAEEIYPVGYMSLYRRYPNVENLIMQGWGSYLNHRIYKTIRNYGGSPHVNNIRGLALRRAKPTEMLGLSKEEMCHIKTHKWSNERIDYYIEFRGYGITLDIADDIFNKYSAYSLRELKNKTDNIPRALRYIEKQKLKFQRAKELVGTRYLADYWEMAEQNGDNLSDDRIRYPHNLVRTHDTAVRQQKLKTDAERAEKFEARYKELEKYCFEADGLSIHPAQSEREMIIEGKILDHCVGSYAKRHADGQTTIFFIRKTDDPETPYYTLEYDFECMCILQNRGFKNCAPPEEVRAFAEKWNERVKGIVTGEIKSEKTGRKARNKKQGKKNERSAA